MTGLIDTNVFIHAQTTDHRSEECRRFLRAVQEGRIAVQLEALVLHELTYALPHYRKQMTRAEITIYLLAILGWEGLRGEIDLLIETVERWAASPNLAFVDAYLAAVASQNGLPVYTLNARHLASQGIDVPSPLPDGTGMGQSE